MSPRKKEVFIYLIATFSALVVVSPVLGWDYYPSSYNWSFQNYCYLDFSKGMNFTHAPHKGVPYDNSLVGYWSMNEGSGTVTSDGSGNSNNGTVASATWTTGKFGSALNFTAGSSILIASTATLNMSDYITLSAWICPRSAGENDAGRIVSKPDYGLALGSGASVNFVTNRSMYALPDPVSLENYHSFEDPETNSTMIVNVDSSNTSVSNIVLVTCTNFFAEKRLTFEANNSATVNMWTTGARTALSRN